MEIREKLIPLGATTENSPNVLLDAGKPLGIVVHQTGTYAPWATAAGFSLKLQRDQTEVSWHTTADDKVVIQNFADNRKCWHVGHSWGNSNLMGIELCVHNKSDKEAYLKTLRNGAYYVATKMKKYGWDLSKVHRHREYVGTSCPKELSEGLHDVDWEKFKKMITEELSKLNGVKTDVSPKRPEGQSLSKVAKKYMGETGMKFIEWNTGEREWDDWCAYFVSYCIYKTYGIIRKFGFVDDVIKGLEEIPNPEKDCLVWFDRNSNGRGDHIGICSYANGDNFAAEEGNTKNEDNSKSVVSENSYNVSDLPFRFFRIPESMKNPVKNLPVVGKPMKVVLVEDTKVFTSVDNAESDINGVIYKAGEYRIYKTAGEYVNITKSTTPGGWVKLKGIK